MAELNDEYKKRHKPIQEGKTRFHQGYYIPQLHPEKCLSATNIARSSWEYKFYDWCDRCDSVIRWASEPIRIRYKNPITNFDYCVKNHLDPKNPMFWKEAWYYTDAWIELQTKSGEIRKIFIEIKPYSQSVPPEPLKPDAKMKDIKKFNRDAQTYLVNQHKWRAAKEYCQSRGTEFMVVTEKTLKQLGLL